MREDAHEIAGSLAAAATKAAAAAAWADLCNQIQPPPQGIAPKLAGLLV